MSMSRQAIAAALEQSGVVAIIRLSDPSKVDQVFRALVAGGIRALEITMQNTRDVAELTKKTTKEATGILRDRLHESLAELRDSISRGG